MNIVSAVELIKNDPSQGEIFESRLKPFKIYRLNSAVVFGEPPLISPIRLNQDNNLSCIIDESTNYPWSEFMLTDSHHKAITPNVIYENCALLNNHYCANFYHWITESLPRLLILEASGFDGAYIVPDRKQFVDESLELLGIPMSRVIKYNEPFIALNLYLTDKFRSSMLYDKPGLLKTIRRMLCGSERRVSPLLRVYIKRTQRRRVVNEEELMSILEEFGFIALTMESMSLKEQIELMMHTNYLVLPHGAGTIHSLFMPEGSVVVELFSVKYVNPCCMPIMEALGHRYYMVSEVFSVPPKTVESDYFKGYVYADIVAPTRIIKHILRQELLRTQDMKATDTLFS